VTSRKDQGQYWYRQDRPYCFVPVKKFADAFRTFHVGRSIQSELSEPFDRTRSHPAALATSKFGVDRKELLKATIDRELLLMKRNAFMYIFKSVNVSAVTSVLHIFFVIFKMKTRCAESTFCSLLLQLTLMAFIVMTTFFRTNMKHDFIYGAIYMGALYFALDTIMFNGFAELSMTVMKLPVFFKQRDLLFFPAWAYTIPSWILQIPITFFEVGVYVFTTYYVIGFDSNVTR
jgi:hypothetical protein